MFNSLEEELKRDRDAVSTRRHRLTLYAVVFAVSAVLFGGLYVGIRLLE